jgi:mono/diheme cytochrome c family protein
MRSLKAILGGGVLLAVAFSALPGDGASANVRYAADSAPIYAAAGHASVGSLTPGTPVTPSGAATKGFQPFTLRAWSQKGDSSTLVVAQGKRVVLATLSPGARTKIVATAEDTYGNVWDQVELSGFVKTSAVTSDQAAVWAQAAALYTKRCSACHALHKTTEFTANQWPAILKTMTKNAALQPSQAALVMQYLQTHAKS